MGEGGGDYIGYDFTAGSFWSLLIAHAVFSFRNKRERKNKKKNKSKGNRRKTLNTIRRLTTRFRTKKGWTVCRNVVI